MLDLGYSDGLSVISVFEQRGQLPASLAGWRKTTVAGHPIFVAEPDQRSLTWSGRGMVYTVVADAPTQTVDAVVGALPHDKPPGFWKRMTRGHGPAGVLGQSVPLTPMARERHVSAKARAPVITGQPRPYHGRWQHRLEWTRERVFTCPTEG